MILHTEVSCSNVYAEIMAKDAWACRCFREKKLNLEIQVKILSEEVGMLRKRPSNRLFADGQERQCYYCNEPCDSFSGNPSRWPIPLCHADDPGRVKWHHIGCVSERLIENNPGT